MKSLNSDGETGVAISGDEGTKRLPPGFAPISLRSFEAGKPPLVDLYCMVDDQLVLYCEAESVFSEQAKIALLDNGVETLYVDNRKGKPILDVNDLARVLSLPMEQMPPLVKAGLLYSSTIQTTKRVLANADDPGCRSLAQRLVSMTVSQFLRHDDVFHAIVQMMRHDPSVYSHSVNVCAYGVALGIKLGFSVPDLLEIGLGALLHDAGKTRVPVEILTKPGPLTAEEWAVMQQHPAWGAQMMQGFLVEKPVALTVVLCHHERLDGSGYPAGQVDEAVLPAARVASLVDVYDALTSERPYRPALRPFDALYTMETLMRRQLDQRYLGCFVELLGGR